MIKRIGFIITLGVVIFLASSSSALKESKAAQNSTEEDGMVTVDVSELETVSEEALLGYKEPGFYKGVSEYDEIDVSDLTDLGPISEDMIIGYKDDSYFNRFNEEYSHKTVIIAVDEEILDDEKVSALCEKYGLSITYDYNNFNMYALSSSEELTEEGLNNLIEDLSNEAGILNVSKDYICHTTDSEATGDFGLCVE